MCMCVHARACVCARARACVCAHVCVCARTPACSQYSVYVLSYGNIFFCMHELCTTNRFIYQCTVHLVPMIILLFFVPYVDATSIPELQKESSPFVVGVVRHMAMIAVLQQCGQNSIFGHG